MVPHQSHKVFLVIVYRVLIRAITSSRSTPGVHSHGLGAAFRGLMLQAANAPRLAEPTFKVQIYGGLAFFMFQSLSDVV